MLISGAHYIAGTVSREGSAIFHSVDPRTGALGSAFVNATPAEIDRAVQAAQEAFAQTRAYPAARIAALLDAIALAIEDLGDDLLALTEQETGLPNPRLRNERARTTGQLRKFAALLREGSYVDAIIDSALPDRTPAPRPSIRRMLVPIGPVAVFAASNFPYAFSVAGGDTASALAAGCPVIVKAHPGHPATSEQVARAIQRAVESEGFPAGTFSMLQGDQVAVGQALVTHPGVSAIGFTGSLRAGRAIFDAAAARPRPIPVYAEMGSTNPCVVLPEAITGRGDSLVDGLANSVTLGTGQFCTNPGLVFAIDTEQSRLFIERFTQNMQARQPGVLLNAAIQNGLVRAVAGTRANPNVTLLTGGEPLPGPACGYAHTVLQTSSAAFRADDALQTEHFGPVTLFVLCESFADLLATIETLDGNLTASVHAGPDELDHAARVFAILREKAGRLIFNDFPTGVEVVYAMQHGGPYPATTAPSSTSVGMAAIRRFMRPVAWQNLADSLLPDALKDANPLAIWRTVDEHLTRDSISR